MSESNDTVETAYGVLDRAALAEAQANYDTRVLLRMVDELDSLLAEVRAEDGLRDMLLRLHAMAHTVITGAGMAAPTDEESLPELAFDTVAELRRMIVALQAWVRRIEPLDQLAPRH